MPTRRYQTALLPSLMLVLTASACAPAFELGEPASSSRGRDDYVRERARRADPAIAAWTAAADAALRAPAEVALPHVVYLELTATSVFAGAYAFELRPGGRMRARLTQPRAQRDGTFFELFQVTTTGELRLVDAAVDKAETLARDGGRYILRVQPRLHTAGTFRLSIEGDAAWREPVVAAASRSDDRASARYVFPVDGRDVGSIRSGWGDPRAGGRRHEGVDIFAPRGTPVLAADDGLILAVRETPIGGKVIWLKPDGMDVELYYAHLDRQDVRPGERVRAGAQIGLVGNTGNARTTPPHLHFGVYRRGGRAAIDPADWIAHSAPLIAAGNAGTQP